MSIPSQFVAFISYIIFIYTNNKGFIRFDSIIIKLVWTNKQISMFHNSSNKESFYTLFELLNWDFHSQAINQELHRLLIVNFFPYNLFHLILSTPLELRDQNEWNGIDHKKNYKMSRLARFVAASSIIIESYHM